MNKDNYKINIFNTKDEVIKFLDNNKASDKKENYIMLLEDFLRINMGDNSKLYVMSDENGEVYNYASVSWQDKNILHLDYLNTIRLEDRNKGLGSEMLDYIIKDTRKSGFKYIGLHATSKEGQGLYNQKGFVAIDKFSTLSNADVIYQDNDYDIMYKMLDEQNWAYSVLFSEALNTVDKNNNKFHSVGAALHDIIANEKFDNMFQYAIIDEEKKPSGKDSKINYDGWVSYITRRYLNDPVVPIMANLFDSVVKNDEADFVSLKQQLKSMKDKQAQKDFNIINLRFGDMMQIVDGVRMLNSSSRYIKKLEMEKTLGDKNNVVTDKYFNENNSIYDNIVDGLFRTKTNKTKSPTKNNAKCVKGQVERNKVSAKTTNNVARKTKDNHKNNDDDMTM